ncbi:GntR family transcriptional regulator [Ruania alba]|uniref:DNA-binding transcriptional regulator, GntR family n=1 Tax=Ruania alba TaxID=648782 RepID=A0A1H5KSG7_9MICO|nr:GntR family transcriptional regulator [Ruania alba]SEE67752.1 DNA-binding transcriptional regulator, GntR family [Ruania alba]
MTPPAETTGPAPKPTLALEQPVSRGDRVRDVIQAAILDTRLPQGTPLVERELSAMLGVSKTPIREALKQLQSSGLVVSTAYQGMRVRVLDAAIVREVTDARLAVEPQALHLAIATRGASELDEARQLLRRTEALVTSENTAELSVTNRAFHRCLYAACGNDLLIDFLDKLQALSMFIATAGWHVRATYDQELAEHRQLLDAFERGDGESAATILRHHISTAAEGTLQALDQDTES